MVWLCCAVLCCMRSGGLGHWTRPVFSHVIIYLKEGPRHPIPFPRSLRTNLEEVSCPELSGVGDSVGVHMLYPRIGGGGLSIASVTQKDRGYSAREGNMRLSTHTCGDIGLAG